MFNPVIVGAIIGQVVISKVSRKAGAIAGYLITTGIFIWGLDVYSHYGHHIALFNVPLSKEAFIIACLIWYAFDTKEFVAAMKSESDIGTYEDPNGENVSVVGEKTNILYTEQDSALAGQYRGMSYEELLNVKNNAVLSERNAKILNDVIDEKNSEM